MTTTVKPVFKNNLETSSIIASSNITMIEEIPDTQKTYSKTSSTTLTPVGANFQTTNLNQWIDGTVNIIGTRTYKFTGQTVKPNQTAGLATGPMLWNPVQSSVDAFAINKSISQVKNSIAGKSWTDVDRQNPEMIDIIQTQFDIDKLASHNINGDGMISSALPHLQSEVNGSTFQDRVALYLSQGALMGTAVQVGYGDRNTQTERSSMLRPYLQNQGQYVKVKSVTYEVKGGGPVLETKYDTLEYPGLPVPYDAVAGDIYFSVVTNATGDAFVGGNNTLIQTVELEIHEDLISPDYSNRYSKNPHKKIYYSGGYPFSLDFQFNQEYAKSMLKWVSDPRVKVPVPLTGAAVTLATTTVQDMGWTGMSVGFWSFDSAKPLPEQPIKTLYFKQSPQTTVVRPVNRSAVSAAASTADFSLSTSSLSSLPPIALVYVACRPGSNPSYFSNANDARYTLNNTPYVELFNIDKLGIRVGTQNDAFGGIDENKYENVDHTLEVLGNPEYREMLMSQLSVVMDGELGNLLNLPGTLTITPQYLYQLRRRIANKIGFNFYFIDFARLNIRTTDGVPLLPSVIYGSHAYKALTFDVKASMTEEMHRNCEIRPNPNDPVIETVSSLTGELNVILMYKHIRTLPLLSGGVTDNIIEYNINDISPELYAKMNEGYSDQNGSDQLAYVGGSFTGNLLSHISNFIKHPALKSAAAVSRLVRDATADKDSDALRAVHSVTSALSSAADMAGLGAKRSKYGRA